MQGTRILQINDHLEQLPVVQFAGIAFIDIVPESTSKKVFVPLLRPIHRDVAQTDRAVVGAK